MTTEPKSASAEKELRVRRGRVASVDLYEIKESELDLLEKGAPSGLYLNFAIFLLSIGFAAIATFTTASFNTPKLETLFMIIAVVGSLGGVLLLILWWRTRTSVSETVEGIRNRIPADEATLLSTTQSETGDSGILPKG